ncbi:c-di-AMP phosphodiesterase, consists of a GGDEF-like and DHH domains [Ligilactobacillus sp. WC1T17]|uniref:Cyclic-di-AMP phosphodiesterase n=1 Tax=Ligilactobacillus ruminis TaxID=1623 RepID=A0ABY1A940_9LACO|nr:c-di-AMP phosphodiesterase, consists of a GGDEF-like and DHH domains [Ligilactobacillus ruminis]
MPDFIENAHLRQLALILVALAFISVLYALFLNPLFGLIMLVLVIIVLILAYRRLEQVNTDTNEYISNLSYRMKRGEEDAMLKMPIGILFYDDNAKIEWYNPRMKQYFERKDSLGHTLNEIDPDLSDAVANCRNQKKATEVVLHGKTYSLLVQKDIKALFMMDVSYYAAIQKHYEDSRIVLGQIFLDNYDEVTKVMNDKDLSNLNSFITNTLDDWARDFEMFIKRVDDDHFFILTYTGSLARLEKEKFKILDVIRERTSNRNSPLTLSVGIAYGGDDLAELARLSQNNLDLALGRGGDQAVVREISGQARFYGGKTNPMEKRTRVRARMISQALNELMAQADQVFVMGHAYPDMDSLGACLGLRRIAAMNNKSCWIVLDDTNLHSDVKRLIKELNQYPAIKGAIISPKDALEKAQKNSLLIMCDHSKPSISVAPELYQKLQNRVMVIDHHRRGEEFPDNPILVYIEPYASSTCELITEMFEYQAKDNNEPVNKIEATAMLTGIIIDTKSFSLRTGTRTFDAASYLRSVGADLGMARHFMKESVSSYMQRSHLVARTEFDDHGNAICCGEEGRLYDPVLAAQVADSLLGVSGVKASYVITQRKEELVGISARSNGDVNVQVIMEQMGGGGHLSNAATQIKNQTIAAIHDDLMEKIRVQN